MSETVERLRASRLSFEAEEYSNGTNCGKKWAEEKAEYGELLRLAKADFSDREYAAAWMPEHVIEVITADNYEFDLWDHEGLERVPEFYRGFVDGAIAVFDGLRDQIESDAPNAA